MSKRALSLAPLLRGYQLLLCRQPHEHEQVRALIGSLLTGYQLLLYRQSQDMSRRVL